MNFWVLGITLVLLVILAWPNLAWRIRRPFLWTNQAQWFMITPYRHWLRDPRTRWPHRLYLAFFPLVAAYRLVAYVLLTPLRLLNAVYFDLLLFWSVSLRDGIADLVHPLYEERGFQYTLRWLYLLPWRLLQFILKYSTAILQGLAMAALDLLWPTLTLFHGTGSAEAKTIARSGEWYAGTGNYVGTGLYFGLRERVGRHYARLKREPLVIIARVTLAPCRLVATLPDALRRQIGRDGDAISRGLPRPWVSVEHWRHDRRWYEFCLMQPSQFDPTKPWRVRPICTVGKSGPERLPGGLAAWPNSKQGWIVVSSSLLLFLVLLLGYTSWTGLLPVPSLNAMLHTLISPGAACPGVPPTRLKVDLRACVADIGADALYVRSAPTLEQSHIVGTIHRGTAMTVLDGPACADGYAWWRVELTDGLTGWVAEGHQDNYFVEPCD